MLKKLKLKNFKSISVETSVDFTPLTVFAGSNSSGKSTLIQSVLLLAQTLKSSVYRHSVVLNGSIVRLGTFQDILSSNAKEQVITIGFEISPQTLLGGNYSGVRGVYYSEEQIRSVSRIGFDMSFSGGDSESTGLAQLQPELERVQLQSVARSEGGEGLRSTMSLRRRRSDMEDFFRRERIETASVTPVEKKAFSFEVDHPTTYRPRYSRPIVQNPYTLGVHLQHFLPRWMCFTYDVMEEECNAVENVLSGTASAFYDRNGEGWESLVGNDEACGIFLREVKGQIDSQVNNKVVSPPINRLIQKYKEQIEQATPDGCRALLAQLPQNMRQGLQERFSNNSVKLAIRSAIRRGRKDERKIGGGGLPEPIDFATNYVNTFFSEQISYLGPLRDEPKPIYPYGGTTDSVDVGIKGEFTAAVLDLHKDTEVLYIPPSAVKNSPSSADAIVRTLSEAVLDWLQYMGIASALQTRDQGKLGHELRISTASNAKTLHDLTHVGVGVSQVLPILVQALLVNPGACLIFEQPELHLHPKVQTKLADFFTSVAVLGKQCIIETHSEYLINELRYLAAVSDDDGIAEMSTVYFVNKENDTSVYESLRFNEFGVIANWPPGFFDESEEIAAETIKAAMLKRAKKKK
ncbi:DUF3696 domain-containing protein [Cupriavidus sp. YAF13]|uniref:AAA family ATPase n=1 Tax=Cupriavidus sp. YAF13 TaxID=3233075 RepID=UPI003F900B0D